MFDIEETAPAMEVNAGFISKLETEGGTKTAAASLPYIKDRLREGSFVDRIIPPKRVQPTELTRSTEHDTLTKIVDIEPDSRAMSINFRDQPDAQYINGKRYAIAFFTISSLKFEITETELLAYEMPITKIIEKNAIKDMVEVKDRVYLNHIEAAVNAMQEEGVGTSAFSTLGGQKSVSKVKGANALKQSADDFVARTILRSDIVKLKKLLKRQVVDSAGDQIRAGRLRPVIMLMTESDADDFDNWTNEETGDKIQGEILVNGYGYKKVSGLRLIRSIKNDILREGNVYVFTEHNFLGRNYILNDIKFYVDKIANKIHWQAWMDVGMGIGNIASIVKLELYSGDASDEEKNRDVIPMEEYELGGMNNKVAEGLTFPNLSVY